MRLRKTAPLTTPAERTMRACLLSAFPRTASTAGRGSSESIDFHSSRSRRSPSGEGAKGAAAAKQERWPPPRLSCRSQARPADGLRSLQVLLVPCQTAPDRLDDVPGLA